MSNSSLMQLEIVSAESSIYSGQISHAIVCGQQGDLGIHPGHTALLSPLKAGQVEVSLPSGEVKVFYVSSGIAEVQPKMLTILADTAKRAEDIDEAAAMAAKEAAEKRVAEQQAGIDHSQALAELAEAAAQLKALHALRRRAKR